MGAWTEKYGTWCSPYIATNWQAMTWIFLCNVVVKSFDMIKTMIVTMHVTQKEWILTLSLETLYTLQMRFIDYEGLADLSLTFALMTMCDLDLLVNLTEIYISYISWSGRFDRQPIRVGSWLKSRTDAKDNIKQSSWRSVFLHWQTQIGQMALHIVKNTGLHLIQGCQTLDYMYVCTTSTHNARITKCCQPTWTYYSEI